MIGIVLVGHEHIASEMKAAVEHVLGKQRLMEALDVVGSGKPELIQAELLGLLEICNEGDGLLVFADMFGGTPCNVSLTCLKYGECEVISGFNLPALIKAASDRILCQQREVSLAIFARDLVASGQQYMCLASDFMPDHAVHCEPAKGDRIHG